MCVRRRSEVRHAGRPKEEGFAFISAVIFLAVVLLLGASMVQQSNQELSTASRAKKDTESFQLAEAGIDYAAWQLYKDRQVVLPVTWSRSDWGGGSFSVTVSKYLITTDTVVLNSTGTAQGRVSQVKVVGKFLTPDTGTQSLVFDHALYSDSDLNLTGTFDVEGDVYANGNTLIQGSPTVTGDVESWGAITVAGNPVIGGQLVPDSDQLSMPTIDLQYYRSIATTILIGNQNLAGETNLNGVTFIDGNAVINGKFRGQGVIVVTGNVTINGSALCEGPTDQFAIVTVGKVRVNGNCTIEGWIYTHNMDVPGVFEGNGTATVYGGVAADVVMCKGTLDVHYEETTLDVPGGSGAPAQFDAISWRRVR